MSLKAIMYHYVRPDDPRLPNFKSLHIDDFRRQLDYFEKEFGFADQQDFFEACLQHAPLPDGVILTFDDGLADHSRYVLPELRQRGLWGMFYVSTDALQTGRLMPVHRVHLLLGRFAATDVAEQLRALLDEGMIRQDMLERFKDHTYQHQDNTQAALFIKRALNYYLDHEYRDVVVKKLMELFFGPESSAEENFYMNAEDVRSLHDAGMLVGSHSHTHPVMSRLQRQDQEFEISHSFEILEDILGPLPIRTFCYPYGGKKTFTEETEKILTQHGVAFSFAVEPRDITADDIRHRPQALPRYDCNMFPHGQCRN